MTSHTGSHRDSVPVLPILLPFLREDGASWTPSRCTDVAFLVIPDGLINIARLEQTHGPRILGSHYAAFTNFVKWENFSQYEAKRDSFIFNNNAISEFFKASFFLVDL